MSTQVISISGKLINVCGVLQGMEDAKTKNTVTGAERGCQSVVVMLLSYGWVTLGKILH